MNANDRKEFDLIHEKIDNIKSDISEQETSFVQDVSNLIENSYCFFSLTLTLTVPVTSPEVELNSDEVPIDFHPSPNFLESLFPMELLMVG